MQKLDKSYYENLNYKVNKYGYTVMSVVSNEPRSEDHAAYCYTIGLSNYGYSEIMFTDCVYDDVLVVSDIVVEMLETGVPPILGQVIDTENGRFKVISLLPGVKEEISEQALFYFELFRINETNYELVFLAKEDEFGLFPDEKIFEKSKHINQMFFEQSSAKPLALPQPKCVN